MIHLAEMLTNVTQKRYTKTRLINSKILDMTSCERIYQMFHPHAENRKNLHEEKQYHKSLGKL